MMRSLYAGVSGLKSHQTRMDVIGNNIANVNTTGFKSSRVTFSDTLSQTLTSASSPSNTLGGTNAKQIGLGSGVGAIDTIFTNGSVQSTGKNTDLCLSGNGLFVVKNGNQNYYTRNGAFEFDESGNYVLPGSGLLVQGWTAVNGAINTSAAVGNIQIQAGKSMPASLTTMVTYTNNLNSAAPTVVSMSGGTVLETKTKTYQAPEDGIAVAKEDYPVKLYKSDDTTVDMTSGSYRVNDVYKETVTDTAPVSPTVNGTATAPFGGMKLKITLAGGITDFGTVSGGYGTAGESYARGTDVTAQYTTLGDSETATSDRRVKVTTSSGYQTEELTTGTYKVGDNYSYDATTVTLDSDTTARITLADGTELDGTPGDTYTVGTSFTYSRDSIKAQPTNTVTITWSDGSTSSGTIGETYTVGDSDPTDPTKTIASLSIVSDVTKLDVKSKIKQLDSFVKIEEMEKEFSIDKMEQDVISKAKATSDQPLTLTMSDGSIITENSGTFVLEQSEPVTTILTAYDTLGNQHSIPVYFTKTKTDSASGNEWTVSVATDGSGNVEIPESDGSITKVHMDDVKLSFTTDGKFASAEPAGQTILTLSNGATGTQKVSLELSQLTQYAGTSTVNGKENGNAAGTLASIDIDKSGTITGTYTNGVKQIEAQVAIAQFTNASGLTKTGDSLYQESNNSGKANIKTAADLGVTITPSSLEMSNVDIANELTDMIVTQRGFQTNSKIITVSDEMLEQVINMKR